jgi:hypothetical protein
MGVIMPARLISVRVPASTFMVMVMMIMTMRVVVMVTRPVIVIMVVIVPMVLVIVPVVVVIVTVIVIVVVRRMDIDVELGCRDAAPIDPLDAERETRDAKFPELRLQQFKIQSKVEHRADEHIAADARETVEIESPGHSGYSKVPATMVVITSGWIYLRMA